jgi:hypothetical protein
MTQRTRPRLDLKFDSDFTLSLTAMSRNQLQSNASPIEAAIARRRRTTMKKHLLMMLTAGAVAVIPLIYISEATAAPTASTSVEDTVTKLTADGFQVIVNRTGAAPLAQCTVTAVRPGQTYSTNDSRGGGSIVTTVTSKTVYVDASC